MATYKPYHSINGDPPSGFEAIWKWLTRPHPTLTTPEAQKRAQLIASLTLILSMTVFWGVLIWSRLRPITLNDPDSLLLLGAALVLLSAFFINRAGYCETAARLAVITSMLTVIIDPFLPGGVGWVLTLEIVPVLMVAFLYTPKASVWVSVITVVSALLLIFIVPINDTSKDIYLDTLLFVAIIDGIILAFMFYQQGMENERRRELELANQLLRESEVALEERVQHRTAELEQARLEAENANKLKTQFLANVSHELRTPLNAVLNFNQFVSSGLFGAVNDRQYDALEKSTESARHLLSLINEILDMSKIEAGRLTLEIEHEVDLLPEIQAVISVAEVLVEKKPVEFIREIPQSLPNFSVDKRRFRQVLLNLLSNSAKFTQQGYIKLSIQPQDDHCLFTIKDTGPGIPLDDQTKVFEPFHQIRQKGANLSGTGLGLPISLRLVEAHGGQLWFISEVGQGTTFYVSLPYQIPKEMVENNGS